MFVSDVSDFQFVGKVEPYKFYLPGRKYYLVTMAVDLLCETEDTKFVLSLSDSH